jgi:hypothetical protein
MGHTVEYLVLNLPKQHDGVNAVHHDTITKVILRNCNTKVGGVCEDTTTIMID